MTLFEYLSDLLSFFDVNEIEFSSLEPEFQLKIINELPLIEGCEGHKFYISSLEDKIGAVQEISKENKNDERFFLTKDVLLIAVSNFTFDFTGRNEKEDIVFLETAVNNIDLKDMGFLFQFLEDINSSDIKQILSKH